MSVGGGGGGGGEKRERMAKHVNAENYFFPLHFIF